MTILLCVADKVSLKKKESESYGSKNVSLFGKRVIVMEVRVIVLLCENLENSLEKSLVIVKQEKLRCFKNTKIDKQPLTWKTRKTCCTSTALVQRHISITEGLKKIGKLCCFFIMHLVRRTSNYRI